MCFDALNSADLGIMLLYVPECQVNQGAYALVKTMASRVSFWLM